MPKIEGYLDEENHILYLELISIYNATRLHEIVSAISEKDFSCSEAHGLIKSHEVGHIFGLVYLFSVCHLLILTHPVSQFDISYDRLFQRVAALRQKLVPVIKDVLKDCGVGRDWWVNARPSPPRLLLVFQRCHLSLISNKQPDAEIKNGNESGIVSKKKKTPVKRLQHTMEDQVYRILRSSRVLTNNAVNCLFSVPPNQAFVHIMAEEQVHQPDNPTTAMFKLLRESFKHHRDPHSTSRAKQLLMNTPLHWKEDYAAEDDDMSDEVPASGLKSFLFQHTSLVLDKKGFNDSIGRNPMASHFELPTLKVWLKVANGLYNLLLTDANSLGPEFESSSNTKKNSENGKTVLDLFSKVANLRQQLTLKIDIETKFSEARCGKVLPMAVAVYQNSLPPHYTSKVHNNQLAQALHTFNQHARGPAIEKYREQLKSECIAFWRNGRQLCEVRSLTDRHCVHRYHILAPPNGVQDPDADPPILHHSSRSRSTATSSCGTVQGMRDDPFDLKEANYEFYVQLDKKAHVQPLEVYPFPVYHPGEESQGNLDDCYNTAGTASYSSQVIGIDHHDYRANYSALIQSSSVPTQEYESVSKDGRKVSEKMRSLEHSESAAEGTAEEFDNPVSTQESYEGKENADVSSQEVSQGKPHLPTSVVSPVKSPKRDFGDAANLESQKILKETKSHVATNLNFAFSFGGQSEGSGRMHSPVDNDSQRDANTEQEQMSRNFSHIRENKVNFIDGMIHSNCKKGALPLYPSWSLAKIGNCASYSAMRGLESPGFLPGTNFLIPWDIFVDKPREDMQQWPSPSEAPLGIGKKILPQLKDQKTVLGRRNKDDSTVRAFIGYEYETLRGQRFICSSPDKPVKVTSSGVVKESCHKLLESDMPLYTPSPASGRGGKTLIGQLMRVYIVIPPEPSIEISINPQVVPGPSPTPTFTTGVPDISLSTDSVWVLRFPYVYFSDLGPHYIPKDATILQMCRVLKGLIKLNSK